jgi:alpha-L-fucosidase
MLQEDIRRGQRVRWFAVEAAEGAGWRTIAEGTTIGFKRLFRIPVVESSRVRLVVRDARGAPVISEIGLFRSSPREALH